MCYNKHVAKRKKGNVIKMMETILTDLFFNLCNKYSKEDWRVVISEHYEEWINLCAGEFGMSFIENEEYISFMKENAPTRLM